MGNFQQLVEYSKLVNIIIEKWVWFLEIFWNALFALLDIKVTTYDAIFLTFISIIVANTITLFVLALRNEHINISTHIEDLKKISRYYDSDHDFNEEYNSVTIKSLLSPLFPWLLIVLVLLLGLQNYEDGLSTAFNNLYKVDSNSVIFDWLAFGSESLITFIIGAPLLLLIFKGQRAYYFISDRANKSINKLVIKIFNFFNNKYIFNSIICIVLVMIFKLSYTVSEIAQNDALLRVIIGAVSLFMIITPMYIAPYYLKLNKTRVMFSQAITFRLWQIIIGLVCLIFINLTFIYIENSTLFHEISIKLNSQSS